MNSHLFLFCQKAGICCNKVIYWTGNYPGTSDGRHYDTASGKERIAIAAQHMETAFGGNAFIYAGKDGAQFCFKAVDESDRDRILAGFKQLSPQSVYNRFFEHLKELSPQHIQELIAADQHDHVVWGAFDIEDSELSGAGIARYKREPSKSDHAELAITVVDAYQDQGVGTILLAILYAIARRSGIRSFTGIALSNNWRMINRFIKIGSTVTRSGSEYHMLIPVYSSLDDMPKNQYAQLLKGIVHDLEDQGICS
jgi:acetyltransferase